LITARKRGMRSWGVRVWHFRVLAYNKIAAIGIVIFRSPIERKGVATWQEEVTHALGFGTSGFSVTRNIRQEKSRNPETRWSHNHSVKWRTGVIVGRKSRLGRVCDFVHLKSRIFETRFPDLLGSVQSRRQRRGHVASEFGNWRFMRAVTHDCVSTDFLIG
jgi:hypothetical protein